jgi:hypothetical protein
VPEAHILKASPATAVCGAATVSAAAKVAAETAMQLLMGARLRCKTFNSRPPFAKPANIRGMIG